MKPLFSNNVSKGSVDELTCAQKAHIIFYMESHPDVQLKSLTKKFSVKSKVIIELESMSVTDVLDRKTNWKPQWDKPDVIFHPNVDYDELDLPIGEDDHINMGTHIEWTNDDCILLLVKLFERSFDSIRDTEVNTLHYNDSLEFIKSDVSKLLCKMIGLDHEVLIKETLVSKRNFDQKETNDYQSLFTNI
mgnify:CR=1 FL=1|jgi:hypothetical protein|tara:strand:- start:5283 stop:5852 length:570 start_codon:yes stop_codon:yes gene_type:complete